MRVFDFGIRPLTSLLSEDDMACLCERATRARYADGQFVHVQGDPCDRIGFVSEGGVLLVRRRRNGRQVLTQAVSAGNFFGPFGAPGATFQRTHDAVAVGPTIIDYISYEIFEEILEDRPKIARAVITSLGERLRLLAGIYDDARLLPPVWRVAKLLLMMRRSEAGEVLHCRQEDLIQAMGISNVTLSAALKSLAADGWIDTGYRFIRLLDVDGLTEVVRRVES